MGNAITEHMRHHTYDEMMALKICENIASGLTLKELCELDDMPNIVTVYKWLSLYPPFFDAFHRAKEISALSLEEEALLMARELKGPNDFTGVKVQAYNIAMQQLRWSASRRNPGQYGQKALDGGGKVSITITSSLNIAQDGQPPTDNAKSIYTIEFDPSQATEKETIVVDDAADGDTDLDTEIELPDNALGATEQSAAFGVPKTVDHSFRKKRGRPKDTFKGVVGHRKSANRTKSTATRLAAKLEKLTGGARNLPNEDEDE